MVGNEINHGLNARIKEVREDQGMSQRAFASAVGVSGASIAKIETDVNNPSEQTIRMICSVFKVNREWLEYGFEPKYKEDDLDDWATITEVMQGASENKKKLMRILADMPDELLDKMLEYLEGKYR